MSDQKIAGYREITPAMLSTVNENKLLEELVLRQLDKISDADRGSNDQRWIAVARTHFQEGFMALNRSIMQPTRLTITIDQLEKFEDDTIVLTQKLVNG